MLASSQVGRARPGTRSIAGRTTMSPEPEWNFVTSRASSRRWRNGLRPAAPQDVVVEDEHLVAGLGHRLQHPVMENRVAGDPVCLLDDEDPEAGPLGAAVVLEGRQRCG